VLIEAKLRAVHTRKTPDSRASAEAILRIKCEDGDFRTLKGSLTCATIRRTFPRTPTTFIANINAKAELGKCIGSFVDPFLSVERLSIFVVYVRFQVTVCSKWD
jgi:hypothetical protein